MKIESRLMFKVMFSAAALMHICFMVMFFSAGVLPLAVFNICSVLLYAGGAALAFTLKTLDNHVLALTLLVYAEVTAHAIIATLLIGFDSCFLLYAISILPMCAFTLYPIKREHYTRCMIIMPIFSTLIILATLVIDNRVNRISGYELTTQETNIMRAINFIFNLILVFGFSFLYVNQMNHLLKKLSDSNEQLNYIALHDALTGLFNRRSLWEFLSVLNASGAGYCVVMGDIDNFKRTNDTFGHDCGDQVLKQIADVIRNNIGSADMACRWGGEEMLIIMIGSRGECLERVSEIRQKIAGLGYVYDGQSVPTTMTFGFADSSESASADEIDSEALISLADKRLYTGKKGGKNVVVSQ